MIETRRMQPQEAIEVRNVAKKAFGGLERYMIGKPKEAMIALIDGKIVGGSMIKYIDSKPHRIGYYDGAFIHPAYHGKGVGTALYKATREYLWTQGCTAQAALVKDDNVGSWKLLVNHGFARASFFEGVKRLGLRAMMKFYFFTPFFAGIGMELYLSVKDTPVQHKAVNTLKNSALYLLINLLLVLLGGIGSSKDYPVYLASFSTVFAGGLLFSWLGTLFSERNWHFRLNNGGAFLCGVLNFSGSLLPMIGAWYPKKYEKSKVFSKDMGLVALLDWASLIGIGIVSFFLISSHIYFKYLYIIANMLLFYRMIPLYPFESFGGGRVYGWNKGVYGFMAILSVGTMLLRVIFS